MTRRKPKHLHKEDGRPTVVTPEVLAKLEQAFMAGLSDRLACIDAGISEDALYDYCKKNPKFAERKELLKNTPDIDAHKTLAADTKNVPGARWWGERRIPDFMPKSKVELGGRIQTEDVGQSEAAKAVKEKYEKELRETIAAGVKAK